MVTFFEIADSALPAFAILASVSIYRHGLTRERKNETIQCLSRIRRRFPNAGSLPQRRQLGYLNELEYFATGVNEHIYDIKIVQKMSGRILLKDYEHWARKLIEERRNRPGKQTIYCEYEKMMKGLKERMSPQVCPKGIKGTWVRLKQACGSKHRQQPST